MSRRKEIQRSRRLLIIPTSADPFGSYGKFKGFCGAKPSRDTVSFFEKYSIGSIYFKCLSGKIGVERRLRDTDTEDKKQGNSGK